MKALKIFLLVLIVGFGVAACEKSTIKPCTVSEQQSNATVSDQQVNARIKNPTNNGTGDPQTNEIVGSGDDDRDGGDKKKAGR